MAESVIPSVVQIVAEYTVGPILRQLGYIVFYKRNIKDREKQLENLRDVRQRVQHMVDEAKIQNYVIYDDVSKWLVDADKFIESSDKSGMSTQCFNLFQRHNLGRKAKKISEQISELIKMVDGKKFEKIGLAKPFQGSDSTSNDENYQNLESRMSTARDIKDALADFNVNKVGVYGMGGVGKTMLVEEVKRLVKEDKLFDLVITATIGQSFAVKGIQAQIGSMLRLEFKVEESEEGRAVLLRNKLESENKILIVLDDLWKELNLRDIGIPCKSEGIKGCKILITSRDRDVVNNEMNVQKSFEVKPLSKEESWKFFKNRIGDLAENSIEPIAKKVAKECAGLPIALATVGTALKGKTLDIWKDALKQLGNPTKVNIKGVNDKVYYSLKLSYDSIQSEEGKLIFLLCSVFPDDYVINLKYLSMCAMGMRLLNDDVNTWDEARNRIMKLVDDLKSVSLLLESGNNSVKMHDVIRDVAIKISKEKNQMSTLSHGNELSEWPMNDRSGSYRAIFANCRGFHNLPQHLKFSQLELLILSNRYWREEKLQISDTFFSGMEKIRVLDLSYICFPQLTTSITRSLANLQTLCMFDCSLEDMDIICESNNLEILRISKCPIREFPTTLSPLTELKVLEVSDCSLEDMNIICESKNLEILRISNCPIRELPATLSQLTELKVLQISDCSNLIVIPSNVISSMMKLEELNLLGFMEWGTEVLSYKDKLIQNVKLSELKCLVHLTSLKIIISPDNIPFDTFFDDLKLERFVILVNNNNINYRRFLYGEFNYLRISSCPQLKSLFPSSIKRLQLLEEGQLTHVWKDNFKTTTLFNSLEVLDVNACIKLKYLMSWRVTKSFVKLEQLLVRGCIEMISILEEEEGDGDEENNEIIFSKLVKLELDDLPKLESFHNGKWKCKLIFPCLEVLKINKCPEMKIFSNGIISTPKQQHHPLLHGMLTQGTFPNLKQLTIIGGNNLQMLWENNGLSASSFCQLQRIVIYRCNNLRFIFPPYTMTTLVSLEELQIVSCELLEGIFEKEESNVIEKEVLLKLSSICISQCPKLKCVFSTSVKCFQQFEVLSIDGSLELFSEVNASSSSSSSSEILFPNLRSLSMPCNAMKRDYWVTQFSRSELLPNLKELCFDGFNDDHDNNIILSLESCQSLYNVEKLEIKNCDSVIEVIFPDKGNNHNGRRANLKELILSELPNLSHVWYLIPSSTSIFSNLKVVSVDWCGGMKNLMSWRVAKSLVKLEELSVAFCKEMISILEEEEGDGDEENDEIIFSNLVKLELQYLETLESFHNGKCKLVFPCLEMLEIDECPEMKKFSNGIISAPKQQHHPLVHENLTQCTFPKLKQLTINGGNHLQMLWENNGLTANSFCKLQRIEIEECNNLRFIFPPYTMTALVSLEKLEIVSCELLEGIFEKEEPNFKEKEITLKLRSICVRQCPQLKSIFPTSIKLLQQLENLSIDGSLDLFSEDYVSSSSSSCCEILFPNLRSLSMPYNAMKRDYWVTQFSRSESLPNLKELCFNGSDNDHDNSIAWPLGSCQLLFYVEKLEIEKCNSLIEVLFPDEGFNHNGRHANLKELSLTYLPNLKHVWKDKLKSSFSNLKVVSVSNCDGLKNLLSFMVAKSLVQLEKLSVRDCREMISIIGEEEGDGDEENDKIIFRKLVELKLKDLPTLASLHLGKCKLMFPCLERLEIQQCPEMKIFSVGTTQGTFPKLKQLTINGGNNLQMLWENNGLTANSFCKLKRIEIKRCNNLRFIFPPYTMTTLVSLEKLQIVSCELLEGIFEKEESNVIEKEVLLKLSSICISQCPELKSIFPTFIKSFQQGRINLSSEGYASPFSNLKVVSVRGCDGLKNLLNSMVAKSLVNLEDLTVSECREMISIIGEEEEGGGEGDEIIFSKLVKLFLKDLPTLASLHLGISKLIFPCLERLNIHQCPEMKIFSVGTTQVSFPQLKELKISGNNLEMFWKTNGLAANSFYKLKVVEIEKCNNLRFIFPPYIMTTLVSLEKLEIEGCELLEGIFENEEPTVEEKNVLPNLSYLCVRGCPQLKIIFPTSIKRLQQLEDLRIDGSLELFFEDNASSSSKILFPKLKELSVPCNAMKTNCWLTQFLRSESLPKFKVLCFDGPEDHDNKITLSLGSCQLLYNIEELKIENCDSLIEILFSDEGNNHNGRHANLKELRLSSLHNLTHLLKDNTETITLFDSLEVLHVNECRELKFLFPPTTMSFSNLKVVSVWRCEGMKNLMSWRVAKSLVKLKKLIVTGCNKIISILEKEEGDGDEENDEIIFSKLFWLELASLPTLASFHIGKCNCKLIFPCLKMLKIDECPEMKVFSNGIISAPKLKHHNLIHGRLTPLSATQIEEESYAES